LGNALLPVPGLDAATPELKVLGRILGGLAKGERLLAGAEGASAAAKSAEAARGMRNPVIREAVERGKQAHKDWNPGPGYRKEVTLENGKRADAVNFADRHVKELKPDNPRAIERGESQVEGYRQQLERQTRQPWTCSVETYCRK